MLRISANNRPLRLSYTEIVDDGIFQLPGWENYTTMESFGLIAVSDLMIAEYKLRLYQFDINTETSIEVQEETPESRLFSGLIGAARIEFDALLPVSFKENKLSLHCGRFPFFRTTLQPGAYSMVTISIPHRQLCYFTACLYKLAPFLVAAVEERPFLLVQDSQSPNWEIFHLLNTILNRKPNKRINRVSWKEIVETVLLRGFSILAPIIQLVDESEPPLKKARQAAEIILGDITKRHTLQGLCEMVDSNTCDLKKTFKRLYGTTITTFSNSVRMQRAVALLITSDISEDDIAREVGYADIGKFAIAFKREMSITAGSVRRAVKLRYRKEKGAI